MKHLAGLLCLVLASSFLFQFVNVPQAYAVIAKVQENQNSAKGNIATLTCTFSSNVGSGSVIIVGFAISPTTSTISSVTDTRSTSYTLRKTVITSGGTNNFKGFTYTGTTTSAGADTIRINFTSASNVAFINCLEFTGITETIVGSTNATGTATSGNTYSLSVPSYTPVANNLVFIYAPADPCSGTVSITYTSGYTSGTGNTATEHAGSNCKNAPGAKSFFGSQADEYIVWSSGSTTAAMTWNMGNSIITGTGVWGEILLELAAAGGTSYTMSGNVSIALSGTFNQAVAITKAPTLGLSPTFNQAAAIAHAPSVSVNPTFNQAVNITKSASESLTPTLSTVGVFGILSSVTESLTATFNQAVGIPLNPNLNLSPTFTPAGSYNLRPNATLQLEPLFCRDPPFTCASTATSADQIIYYPWGVYLVVTMLGILILAGITIGVRRRRR